MTTLYEHAEAGSQADTLSSRHERMLHELDQRIQKLEGENRRLRAIVSAAKSNPPMELGLALHAPGDMVPSHSATDLLDGNVYIFKIGGHQVEPRVFRKNTTGREIKAGDEVLGGVVDKTLRHPCAPNSFVYLEVV